MVDCHAVESEKGRAGFCDANMLRERERVGVVFVSHVICKVCLSVSDC